MRTLKHTLCILALMGFFLAGLGAAIPEAEASGPPPAVIMETTMGRVIIMLYPKEAPKTVANFLRYVDEGFYNSTIFHRVVKMEPEKVEKKHHQQAINIVQGGGYTYPPLRRKKAEWAPVLYEGGGLLNGEGTIAMARGGHPDSAQAEFFFNVLANPGLNPMTVKKNILAQDIKADEIDSTIRPGYCAFGKVIRGWDVIKKIHEVKVQRMGQHQNVPSTPIYIKKMYRAR